MLEVLVDDADDADILRDARHARAQAARAPDDQIDPNAGLRGAVEHGDDLGVDERIQLGDDPRGVARLGMGSLAVDERWPAGSRDRPGRRSACSSALLCE